MQNEEQIDATMPYIAQTMTNKPVTMTQPFTKEHTKAWFLQLEARLSLAAITNDNLRYQSLLVNVPTYVADIIVDINSYTEAKQKILLSFGKTPAEAINQLFSVYGESGQGLGDRKPSEYIRSLKSDLLMTGMDFSDEFMKRSVIMAMPSNLRSTLSGHAHLPIGNFIAAADDIIMYARNHTLSEVTLPAIPTPEDCAAVSQTNSLSVNNKQVAADFASGLCRHHRRFGFHANRCESPCSWPHQPRLQPHLSGNDRGALANQRRR
jgi:hypothetical protein